MNLALARIPNHGMGRAAFYMNRTIYSGLAIQAMDRSQNVLDVQRGLSQFGTPQNWLSYQGVPCRRVDTILNTESTVS
jgi:hypothetical protein